MIKKPKEKKKATFFDSVFPNLKISSAEDSGFGKLFFLPPLQEELKEEKEKEKEKDKRKR